MKKQHVFAALAALAVTFTNVAHAEWSMGGQLGRTSTTIEYIGTGQSDKKSGNAFGIFGQYRGEIWGVHFGMSSNSAEYNTRSIRTGHVGKTKANRTLDVLATLTLGERIDGQINGLAMLGFSSIRVDALDSLGLADNATGVKVALGIEAPFANRWVVQAMAEHADFGELDSLAHFTNLELSQTGFRLNIGYRF
ncbi:MAG: porin family protein [Gammaproteobacteria bacterium]